MKTTVRSFNVHTFYDLDQHCTKQIDLALQLDNFEIYYKILKQLIIDSKKN
jgi:hypothetical protein